MGTKQSRAGSAEYLVQRRATRCACEVTVRWLDPKNDYVFKILFSDPENSHLLRAMIEDVIAPEAPITGLEVLNPEIPADLASRRLIVLDVRASTADGRQLDVEMETAPRAVFAHRLPFTWSRLHANQLLKGEPFALLRPTISIAWLGQNLLPTSRFHSRFRILERETGHQLSDHMQIHLLELPKRLTDGTISPSERRCAEFFGAPNEATFARLSSQDSVMAETVKALRRVSAEEIHFHNAESRRLSEFAHDLEVSHARIRGRAEGREDGLAEGRDAGAREARLSLARALLAEGFEPERIAAVTGLDAVCIDELCASRR